MSPTFPSGFPEFPHHGDRGERRPGPRMWTPPNLSFAISRESGARGVSIAQRVGTRLGWEVYQQELLEFLAQDDSAQAQLSSELPADALRWVQSEMERLSREVLTPQAEMRELPRLMLLLAARGSVVIVGRGAGYILPAESTLHVRVIAPLEDRIAYMSQWQRLSQDEATRQISKLDARRNAFLASQFRQAKDDAYAFDLIVNSSRMGEDACAELCRQALAIKQTARQALNSAVAMAESEPA